MEQGAYPQITKLSLTFRYGFLPMMQIRSALQESNTAPQDSYAFDSRDNMYDKYKTQDKDRNPGTSPKDSLATTLPSFRSGNLGSLSSLEVGSSEKRDQSAVIVFVISKDSEAGNGTNVVVKDVTFSESPSERQAGV